MAALAAVPNSVRAKIEARRVFIGILFRTVQKASFAVLGVDGRIAIWKCRR